jgi:hypothetical protein
VIQVHSKHYHYNLQIKGKHYIVYKTPTLDIGSTNNIKIQMAPRGGGRNNQEQSEDDSMINEMGGQME